MPQLDLFGARRRTQITWHYSIDPLKPDELPMFNVMVTGGRDLAVEHGTVWVPTNVVHEEVAQLLAATWDGYLFGEPDDVRQAVGRTHERWKAESKQRRQL